MEIRFHRLSTCLTAVDHLSRHLGSVVGETSRVAPARLLLRRLISPFRRGQRASPTTLTHKCGAEYLSTLSTRHTLSTQTERLAAKCVTKGHSGRCGIGSTGSGRKSFTYFHAPTMPSLAPPGG